jgi:hypothetical protein
VAMPVALEKYMPGVMHALATIDMELPQWRSVDEKVLALRVNNYNVRKVIHWKSVELEYSSVSGDQELAEQGTAFSASEILVSSNRGGTLYLRDTATRPNGISYDSTQNSLFFHLNIRRV